MKVNSVLWRRTRGQESQSRKTHNQVQNVEHNGCFNGPRTEREHSISDQEQTPLNLHHLSGFWVTIFSRVWKITVVAQKAIAATKLANVNNKGGNIVFDFLSQGAQGVSMPVPNVSTPAPKAANAPIKSRVFVEFFKT